MRAPCFCLPAVVTLMRDDFLATLFFFFFLREEEGRSSILSKLFLALGPFLLFSKNTYEVWASMGRHCFCVLRDKECHGQSKNKEADALPDKMTKY